MPRLVSLDFLSLQRQKIVRQLLPLVFVLIGLTLQYTLRAQFGQKFYILLYPTVFAGALVGGLYPGLAATFIATIGACYFFIPDGELMSLSAGSELFSLLVFIWTGILSSLFGEKLRVATEKELFSKRQVEAVLKVKRSADDRLRLATQAARLYSWEWDLVTEKIWRSQDHDQQYGLAQNQERFTSTDFLNFIHPNDRDLVRKSIQEAVTSQSDLKVEYRVIWPDNSIHWMHALGTVFRNPDGTPARLSGCSMDISERKFAEQEHAQFLKTLEGERERLYSLFRQSPVGVFIVEGKDHIFTLSNEPHLKLVGRELFGRKMNEAFTAHEMKDFKNVLDLVYKSGVIYIKDEVHFSVKDGSELFLNLSFYPFRDNKQNIKGVLGFVQDVTEQVEARNRVQVLADDLKRAVEARDKFLSIASHELKTPLTSLKMQVQMRRRNLAKNNLAAFTEEKLTQMVENDERQINRLTRLIDDMLDISRIGSGKLTIHKEESDLSQLVKEVCERLNEQIALANCKLEIQAPENCIGFWDRFRIEQVVINLLTNALRYGAGHPIQIKIEKTSDQAKLSVTDQGIGIEPENQKRIFQQFERVGDTQKVSGLGLGLYIANQIVASHGGQIKVKSVLGKGSTFTVELPLHQETKTNTETPSLSL